MARSTGSIHIADNSVTAVNDAIQQLLFLIDELRGEHDNTTIHIGPHTHAGGSSGDSTDDQDGGPIAPGTIDHDDLINVTSDQHHAKLHESSHREGNIDELKLDDTGTPDDNTDNDATIGHHGLLPKLSGNSNEFLNGAGAFAGVTAAEATDVSHIEGSTQEQIWEQVLAGTNITITELAGGNAIKIDASGSGSAGNVWSADNPPSSPGSEDDEFADNSGSVPGGWTETDFGAVLTVTEDTNGVNFALPTGHSNVIGGIYKAIPAGDFTIWAKVHATGIAATDQAFIGLTLWQDATDVNGDLITEYLGIKSGNGVNLYQWNAYNSFASTLASNQWGNYIFTHQYLRIRRSGTTYSFDYGSDGLGWQRIYTNTISFTPTHFGISMMNNQAVDLVNRCSFFRYVASDVGLNGLMSGRRI